MHGGLPAETRICIFRESVSGLEGQDNSFLARGKCSIDEHGVDKCFMDGGRDGADVCSIDEER